MFADYFFSRATNSERIELTLLFQKAFETCPGGVTKCFFKALYSLCVFISFGIQDFAELSKLKWLSQKCVSSLGLDGQRHPFISCWCLVSLFYPWRLLKVFWKCNAFVLLHCWYWVSSCHSELRKFVGRKYETVFFIPSLRDWVDRPARPPVGSSSFSHLWLKCFAITSWIWKVFKSNFEKNFFIFSYHSSFLCSERYFDIEGCP